MRIRTQQDQGEKKLVPGRHSVKDEHGHEGRSGKRQDEGEEDPPWAGAVHLGCLNELVGQLPKERLQHEYLERDSERQVWPDQTRNAVSGAHAAQQDEDRHDCDVDRDRQAQEDREHDRGPESQPELCQRKGQHRRDQYTQWDLQDQQKATVPVGGGKVSNPPRISEVLQCPLLRPRQRAIGHEVRKWTQSGDHQQHER